MTFACPAKTALWVDDHTPHTCLFMTLMKFVGCLPCFTMVYLLLGVYLSIFTSTLSCTILGNKHVRRHCGTPALTTSIRRGGRSRELGGRILAQRSAVKKKTFYVEKESNLKTYTSLNLMVTHLQTAPRGVFFNHTSVASLRPLTGVSCSSLPKRSLK